MELAQALSIRHGEVVAFTGAGGKTTAMFRLARELAMRGQRVITTTTTHLAIKQLRLTPHVFVTSDLTGNLPAIARRLKTSYPLLVLSGLATEAGKVQGVSPQLIPRLRDLADVILVEADGARQRSFKAPAMYEPVVPACTTLLVPVVGMDVLGCPLTVEHVHRPERIAALSGADLGQVVTPHIIATVLAHPAGGLKGRPHGAAVAILLNKVESPEQQAAAHEVAEIVLHTLKHEMESVPSPAHEHRPPRVLLCTMKRIDPVIGTYGG